MWVDIQSKIVIHTSSSTCILCSPQAHFLQEVDKLSGECCNTLQKECTERVAKKYTCDDFRSGMYVYLLYLQYI